MTDTPELIRSQPDSRQHYRWAVVGPAGAVDFNVTRGGSPGHIVLHYPKPLHLQNTAACDLLGGACDGDRQMYLPGKSLYKQWVDAGGDDTVIWDRLESFYANRIRP